MIFKRDKLAWVIGILVLGNALSWLAGSFLTGLILPFAQAGPAPRSLGGFLTYISVFGLAFLLSYGIELGVFMPFLKRLKKPFRSVSRAVFWGNVASYAVIGTAWVLGLK